MTKGQNHRYEEKKIKILGAKVKVMNLKKKWDQKSEYAKSLNFEQKNLSK